MSTDVNPPGAPSGAASENRAPETADGVQVIGADPLSLFLPDEAATLELGAALAEQLIAASETGLIVYLEGNLGAGKTTLVRGLLRALGHAGAVKSPTYTLVECYTPQGRLIYHFDLYRLADPEELEYLGGRDYFAGDSVCLVEWPGQGEGWLPAADVCLSLTPETQGRRATLVALTARGQAGLDRLRVAKL